MRARPSGPAIWAAAAPLTVLPTYRFQHDAKLLLIAIPACAILWAERRPIGRIGILIALTAIALTGDIPRAILENLEAGHQFTTVTLAAKLQMIVFNRPAALVLLIMTAFFLWLCIGSNRRPRHQMPDKLEIEVL